MMRRLRNGSLGHRAVSTMHKSYVAIHFHLGLGVGRNRNQTRAQMASNRIAGAQEKNS